MEKYYGPLAVALVILLLMFPYIWKGQDVQVNVVDNLDSNVVWYKMLKDQNKIFAGPQEMVQGLVTETPRFSYPSGLNVEAVLYFLLPPFTAFWVNKLIIIMSAFIGMVLFFTAHLKTKPVEIVVLSLMWASLAHNQHIGISIAGLPLVFWSFINMNKRKFLFPCSFIIIFYSFYSSFVLVGVFTIIFLSIFLIYWCIIEGQLSKMGVLGLLLMSLCFLIQEYNLLYFLFFQDDFVSHRKEMDYQFILSPDNSPMSFITNGDHNGVFYWWGYVLMFVGIVIIFLLNQRESNNSTKIPRSEKVILVFAIVFTFLLFFLNYFLTWAGANNLISGLLPVFHSFNLMRITFPLPFFMFIVIGFGFIYIKIPYKKYLLGFFLVINIFVYQFEWRNWINNHLHILKYQIPSYSQFYAEKQFGEIKRYMGEEWDNLHYGNINLPPAVAAFHGFRCIDGYLPLYDLAYKHNFKRIIEKELESDGELFDHFQYWGNKCYLQNSTYPDQFDAYKWNKLSTLQSLKFNFKVIKEEFNVGHLLSAVKIQHEKLHLLRVFSNEESAWDVYLYKVTQ